MSMKRIHDTGFFASTSDEDLMLLGGKGNKHAFAELIQRHQNGLVNFFIAMGVYTLAEDLAQETLIKVFNYRKRYKRRAKFTTFLYFVARRVHVDYLRKLKREQEGKQRYAVESEIARQPARSGGPQTARALEALNTLSDEMKTVLVMNIYQGLTYPEIAEVLDIPVGTVKTRMFYGLRNLREALRREDDKTDRT